MVPLPTFHWDDLTPLDFVRGRSILLVGDSVDRFLVHFLCGQTCTPIPDSCTEQCYYAQNKWGARFSHHVYPFLRSDRKDVPEKLSGVSVCYIPALQFTLVHAMTFGIIPEAHEGTLYVHFSPSLTRVSDILASDLSYFLSHNQSNHIHPTWNLHNYANMSEEATQAVMDQPGILPYPSLVVAQSAIWDTSAIPVIMQRDNMDLARVTQMVKQGWTTELTRSFMPAIERVFNSSTHYMSSSELSDSSGAAEQVGELPRLFLRTIPPANDQDGSFLADINNEMRRVVREQNSSDGQPASGTLWMWPRCYRAGSDWEFDKHHYGPATLYQVLNVYLNHFKQLHASRQW